MMNESFKGSKTFRAFKELETSGGRQKALSLRTKRPEEEQRPVTASIMSEPELWSSPWRRSGRLFSQQRA